MVASLTEPAWIRVRKNVAFHYFEEGDETSMCGMVKRVEEPYAVSRRPRGNRLHEGCRSCLKMTIGYAGNAKNIYLG